MVKDVIELNCGRWQAAICPRLGANVVRLTRGGRDVLRPLEDEAALKINPYLYGAPILMPANRTLAGRFFFEGREYTLPLNEPANNANLHGAVLYQAFEVIEATATCAVLRLLDKDCRSYPFPFMLTVRYTLSEIGLHTAYEVENIGSGNMPLTFCLHTTFIEPDCFILPIDLCQEKDAHHIPTGRYIALNAQERDYVTGSPSRGRIISGYYHSVGGIARVGDFTYTVSGHFDHWVLFNGRGESGYLCVEPQMGRVNGLNMKDGHVVLAPRERITLSTEIAEM